MKKLVGYIRVSSKGQVDNTSLAAQMDKIRLYCELKGHKLLTIYEDAESGKTIERDGFQKAIDHVFNGGADGIIVWSLDRFARSALRGWQLIADLEEQDKHLVVVNRDLDTTGPTGKLIRNILLAVAEYELVLLRERLISGQQAKKAAGGYHAGQPPYGWQAVSGKLEPVSAEQYVIKEIERLSRSGITSYSIAKHLNKKEYPTKQGGEWTHRTVERILNGSRANTESKGYQAAV